MNKETVIAGAIIRDVVIPNDLKANNSELADSFPQDNNVANKTAIGNDNTRKLGRLKISVCKAFNIGKPYSTIFLIKSNITPTEREITVKAEMANNIGGIICPNNHLSIKDMEYQGVIILCIVFLISD